MKLLSMFLALLLGTVFVITDAAPDRLKKDGESASLHRILYHDDSEAAVTAELMCKIFETFDNMGRQENNDRSIDGLNWSPLCDDFEPLDDFLCPTEGAVEAICSAKKPYENPAVRNNWCHPLFELIEDSDRYDSCMTFCTNYVSAARGGCCAIDCTGVIVPPTQPTIMRFVTKSPILTVLRTVLVRVGLTRELNSDEYKWTLFAPSDEAFSKIPADVLVTLLSNSSFILHLIDLLFYHILFNDEVFVTNLSDDLEVEAINEESIVITFSPIAVNGNKVDTADIDVSNGVIHIIDEVLLPNWVSNSITDRVVADSDLSTLLTLVGIAGLGDTFPPPGELTLVAPINSAFAKLRAETFDWLVSAEGKENLTDLLLYHVLRGVFPSFLFPEESGEFAGSLVLDTFEGGTVHVSAGSGNTIFINDIRIVAEDILANNGVVHKVDTVLDPNDGR